MGVEAPTMANPYRTANVRSPHLISHLAFVATKMKQPHTAQLCSGLTGSNLPLSDFKNSNNDPALVRLSRLVFP